MLQKELIHTKFELAKYKQSDICEHVETLCNYAKNASTILECGVRTAVSTWGFVEGLLNNNNDIKKLVSCDLKRDAPFNTIEPLLKSVIDFNFWEGNDLTFPENETFDIIFIDTWHIYGHLKRELKKFAPMCNKWIIMHDTTVDEWQGETIRCGWDPHQQSIESGYPVDEITKGLWPAIVEFLMDNQNYVIKQRYTNCNGLTILERIA